MLFDEEDTATDKDQRDDEPRQDFIERDLLAEPGRFLDDHLFDPVLMTDLRAETAEQSFQAAPLFFADGEILTLARHFLADELYRRMEILPGPLDLPDEKGDAAKPAPPAGAASDPITQACEQIWTTARMDGAKFAIAMAKQFGARLTGDANSLVDKIARPPWRRFRGARAAANAASQGWLVLAGLKGRDHASPKARGHIAVVVKGPLSAGRYPTAYWGKSDSPPMKGKTLNAALGEADCDKLVYGGIKAKPGGAAAGDQAQGGAQAPAGTNPAR